MIELYDIMNGNEIDFSSSDITVTADDSDPNWTAVLTNPPQNVPAGDYLFTFDFMTESSDNNPYFIRLNGGVQIDAFEMKSLAADGTQLFAYHFPLSWDGGDFSLSIEMAKKTAGWTLLCKYCDFTLTRRS